MPAKHISTKAGAIRILMWWAGKLVGAIGSGSPNLLAVSPIREGGADKTHKLCYFSNSFE